MRRTTIRMVLALSCIATAAIADDSPEAALAVERARLEVTRRVAPAVCAIFQGGGGGSGVIIHPDGWVLSNFHVTGYSKELKVGLPDHRTYTARVVGLDPTGDIALLKLAGKDVFPYAPLGDSDSLAPGEWVLAMGNPFLLATDFSPTITAGIVSGTHRFLPGQGFNLVYADAIQIDAPINPGNSGGPLFNMAGEVVGINGRISLGDRGRVNIGVGYAISANAIRNLLGVLRGGEVVERATLDATVKTDEAGKIVFDRMYADSAAANAGIVLGDELVEFDGAPIASEHQFLNKIWTLLAGWKVKAVIRRGEETETRAVEITLAAIPQRGKQGDGSGSGSDGQPKWEPADVAWRREQAARLAALVAARAPMPAKLALVGTSAAGAVRIEYVDGQLAKVTIGARVLAFSPGKVTDGETVLPHADAQRARLAWSALALPAELVGGPALAAGELVGSGRLDGVATYQVRHTGADGEKLVHHYDVDRARLLAVERWVKDAPDVTVRYTAHGAFGNRVLPSARRIERPGEPAVVVAITACEVDGAPPAPGAALEEDAPRPRPGSPLARAIATTAKSVVRIYGAGHVSGIASYGTGVIVSPDGRVLTHNSAMLETPQLYCLLSTGERRAAKLVHRDFERDVALVQVEVGTEPLPFLTPCAEEPWVGQWVVALGNAFNLSNGAEPLSVNLGILSARTPMHARRALADFPYEGEVYVVDAQINPGCAGGPLLDVAGRWIGLAGKVLNSKETNTQFYFALPLTAVPDLIAGTPRAATAAPAAGTGPPAATGYTGIVMLDAGPFSSPPPFVDRVLPLSPGFAAGLKKDDLILRVDGTRVKTTEDFQRAVSRKKPGETLALSVKRKDQVLALEVKVEADEDAPATPATAPIVPTTRAEWEQELARRVREAASPYERISAARQLSTLGDRGVLELVRMLKIADPATRRACLHGLAEAADKAAPALDALREILARGRREELRPEAALALAQIGLPARAAIEELLAILPTAEPALRSAGVYALAALGADGAPLLALAYRSPATRSIALAAAKRAGKGVIPSLGALAANEILGADALGLLAALGPEAAEATELVLRELDGPRRGAAIDALGAIQSAAAVPALVRCLEADPAPSLVALARIGTAASSALPAVIATFERLPPDARTLVLDTAAAIAADDARATLVPLARAALAQEHLVRAPSLARLLARAGEPGRELVAGLLADGANVDRQRLGCLAVVEGKGTLGVHAPALVLLAGNVGRPDVREAAVWALARAGKDARAVATPAIAKALTDPSVSVRYPALEAVAALLIDDAPILERVRVIAGSSADDLTRELALRALATVSHAAADEAVFLANAAHPGATVRAAAARALGSITPPSAKAIAALVATTSDTVEVQSAAIDGLLLIGEPAVPAIVALMGAEGLADKYFAVVAAGELGPKAKAAAAALVARLADSRAEVREHAAHALGRIGPAAKDVARAALLERLTDSNLDVALAAELALRDVDAASWRSLEEWRTGQKWTAPPEEEKK